jgi:hypothetical protein
MEYATTDVDWDGVIDVLPTREFFLAQALDALLEARVLKEQSEAFGIQLSLEDTQRIDTAMEEYVVGMGGSDVLAEFLKQVKCTKEQFRFFLFEQPLLREHLIEGLYSPGSVKEPAVTDLIAFMESDLFFGRYLFLSTSDEDGISLTGEELKRMQAVAQALQKQAVSDPDLFPSMIEQDGQSYTMQETLSGTLIDRFFLGEDPAEQISQIPALGFSQVFTGEDGLYIVQKLPFPPDTFSVFAQEVTELYQHSAFDAQMEIWKNELPISVTDAYWSLPNPVESIVLS